MPHCKEELWAKAEDWCREPTPFGHQVIEGRRQGSTWWDMFILILLLKVKFHSHMGLCEESTSSQRFLAPPRALRASQLAFRLSRLVPMGCPWIPGSVRDSKIPPYSEDGWGSYWVWVNRWPMATHPAERWGEILLRPIEMTSFTWVKMKITASTQDVCASNYWIKGWFGGMMTTCPDPSKIYSTFNQCQISASDASVTCSVEVTSGIIMNIWWARGWYKFSFMLIWHVRAFHIRSCRDVIW